MSRLDGVLHRLRVWANPRRYDRELATEREFHLEMDALHARRLGRSSATDAEAAAEARRRFGNITQYHEESRTMAGLTFLETVAGDIRFALRSFARTPTFVVVAVATMAVGIGANTAIYSAIDALLLRPLPFANPGELMKISLTRPARGEIPARDDAVWSWPKFAVFRAEQHAFTDAAYFSSYDLTLQTDDAAERVTVEITDAHYFRTLGVRLAAGRPFTPDEDSVPNGRKAIVLSDALYSRKFNADPALLGKPIRIAGQQFVVVGIAPAAFRGMTGRAEAWLPALAYETDLPSQPFSHEFTVIARRKPGVSPDAARQDVVRVGAIVQRTYPDPVRGADGEGAIARELDATRVDPIVRRSLVILAVAVGLVLLIGCTNVAHLFLVRANGRRHEIAVRMALGAGRGRLVRQLLTESVLVSSLGGLVGVALAWGATRYLAALDPTRALRVRAMEGIGAVAFSGVRLDAGALLVTVALSVGTGLLFGLVPALQTTRPAVADDLRNGRVNTSRRWLGVRSRNLLVGLEVAMAVVLLAASGLMTRSLATLLRVDPGVRTDGITTMRFNGREGIRRDSMPQYYDRVVARVSATPGVRELALQDCPPLNGGCNGTSMWRHDRPRVDEANEPMTGVHWISPNWPTVMGVALKRGRLFDERDRTGAPKVVLVSEAAAARLFPGENPLGKSMGVGQGRFDTATVVGVLANVRYKSLDSLPGADVYLPYKQSPPFRMMLFIRSEADPAALVPAVREALHSVEPTQPVYDIRPMRDRVDDSTAYARMGAAILLGFSAIALLLSMIGVYGTISFGVAQRTREIGIRMALGAQPGEVTRGIVGNGVLVAGVGAAIGVVAALAVSGSLRSVLYGIQPTDPTTYVSIVSVLMASVVAACWLPARRAARIEPTVALREE